LISTKGSIRKDGVMTDNNKPEWFEIAENDGPAQPKKVRRSLPIAAVTAIALVIGVGAVVAQTQEESPANAVENTLTQATATATQAAQVKQAAPSVRIGNPSVASTPSETLQNPSIATLPTKGGDDEDDDHGDRPRRGHHDEHEDDDEGEED